MKHIFTSVIVIFLFLFLFLNDICAQSINNHGLTERFNNECVQIEEFIQRFNFNDKTKILDYLKITAPGLHIERKELIQYFTFNRFDTTLFNKYWTEVFIDLVTDSVNPIYLDFYDDDWYAEISCVFKFENKLDTAKLILANQHNDDFSSKWVIVGINAVFLKFPESKDTMRILSPVSHGTDFIALYNIIDDGENIQNYITKGYDIDQLTYFISIVYFNKIKLKEIYQVKYHFLQIPKWIFTVDYFNRNDLNSGWLISKLLRATMEEKENYKIETLQINNL